MERSGVVDASSSTHAVLHPLPLGAFDLDEGFWAQLATGESRYADQIEWTLFNAVLCGIGLDGTSFFYENPLSSRGERARESWFACACCPPKRDATARLTPPLLRDR